MKNKDYGLLRKSGDRGITDLFSGEKILKSSPRMDSIGELDELGCVIGVARIFTKPKCHAELLKIQRMLFIIGSEIATSSKLYKKLPQKIDQNSLHWIDKTTQNLYKKIKMPKGFILSGSNAAASYLQLARAVTRRCERSIVRLHQKKQLKNKNILAFLNRLSVYFFLLSIWHDKKPILVKNQK